VKFKVIDFIASLFKWKFSYSHAAVNDSSADVARRAVSPRPLSFFVKIGNFGSGPEIEEEKELAGLEAKPAVRLRTTREGHCWPMGGGSRFVKI